MTKTILVVEDERALKAAVQLSLIKNGFDVLMASSATEAMNILKSDKQIDCVWLDHYLLGDDTGLDILYELKNSDDWKGIPVFAVTNSVGDDKVQSYELLGIEKYFVKSDSTLNQIISSIKETIE